MRNTDGDYRGIWKEVLGIFALVIFIVAFFSCCKTTRHIKKATSDSTNVSKVNEVVSKTDSSGSKSDKTTTEKTVYYPQPIYIQGKDGETKTIFVPQYVEKTGTEKTEDFSVKKDESWREAFDSLSAKMLLLSQASSTKVGLGLFEKIVICALVFLFIKPYIPNILKFKTKTNEQSI